MRGPPKAFLKDTYRRRVNKREKLQDEDPVAVVFLWFCF